MLHSTSIKKEKYIDQDVPINRILLSRVVPRYALFFSYGDNVTGYVVWFEALKLLKHYNLRHSVLKKKPGD